MTTKQVSHSRLRELLHYDAVTGVFTNRQSRMGGVVEGSIAGTKRSDGYIKITIDRKQYYAHKLAWFYVYDVFPDLVDHVDRNRSNNRIENLRLATASQNQQNQLLRSNNTSGFKGVSYYKRTGKWKTEIQVNGVRKCLGYFDTPEKAFEAYTSLAAMIHSHRPEN
jgi:hypothetical protein